LGIVAPHPQTDGNIITSHMPTAYTSGNEKEKVGFDWVFVLFIIYHHIFSIKQLIPPIVNG
jgi:hypothetical protein